MGRGWVVVSFFLLVKEEKVSLRMSPFWLKKVIGVFFFFGGGGGFSYQWDFQKNAKKSKYPLEGGGGEGDGFSYQLDFQENEKKIPSWPWKKLFKDRIELHQFNCKTALNIQTFCPYLSKIYVKKKLDMLSLVSERFGDLSGDWHGRFFLSLGDSWIIWDSWLS